MMGYQPSGMAYVPVILKSRRVQRGGAGRGSNLRTQSFACDIFAVPAQVIGK
jgi:hypothetical protein